ncbi:hypothetical protein SAMN04488030_0266 [Aliiroseovarius halocynthiae]|uniref:Uncharacterized protein n=1 Tax=Aliiroseovarius halocynthiae TaxID=985055 RepID=A0A545SYE9_9RHOB|nr:hypothetical protein [Aliiroseovarius halocynthiae]TQV69988.1 hypothetical protein FIL88_01040 [Aliiroseovarius halocynthiae]SMR70654.1 hypothetical protein SAMN04488030_0266 [Aliiroseovarius halocynthiae]
MPFLIVLVVLAALCVGLLVWFRSKRKALKQADVMNALLEGIFKGRFAEFAHAIDLPYHESALEDDIISGAERPDADMHQAGRLIMGYFAHNPAEAALFLKSFKDNGFSPEDGVDAIYDILNYEHFHENPNYGPLRLVCYRAVEALMTNNVLPCFKSVDRARVSEMVTEMTRMQAAAR